MAQSYYRLFRLCFRCYDPVEDELHVLIRCNAHMYNEDKQYFERALRGGRLSTNTSNILSQIDANKVVCETGLLNYYYY